jgi:hypothetical protein
VNCQKEQLIFRYTIKVESNTAFGVFLADNFGVFPEGLIGNSSGDKIIWVGQDKGGIEGTFEDVSNAAIFAFDMFMLISSDDKFNHNLHLKNTWF